MSESSLAMDQELSHVPDQHVIPLDDLLEHFDSTDCWCDPKIKVVGATLIVIHNAFDGREENEECEPT